MMARRFEMMALVKRSEHCGKCGTLKVALKNGILRCPPCRRRYARDYYHKNEHRRAQQRQYDVFRKYGVRMCDLERLLEEQGGRCAICMKEWRECVPAKHTPYERIFLHHLCIDHDHRTHRVRGLLCNSCNAIIGFSEENEEYLANAVLYLRRHAELSASSGWIELGEVAHPSSSALEASSGRARKSARRE